MKLRQVVRVVFVVLLLLPGVASAADSQVQVLVGDVCPNITGNQPSLPSGMQHNQNGECYTPAPPPPPDACPNLTDHQTTIPAGYYRNQSGNCAPQTKPPKDVCSNIVDIQAEVPFGMQTAENADCIWPPTDVCTNIAGPQEKMPEGMAYSHLHECYTPSPVTTPTTGRPAELPFPSAKFNPLPYYIIAGLAFVTLLLLLQTIRESFATRANIAFYRRRKREGEAIDVLIILLLRYLKEAVDAMIDNLPPNTTQKEEAMPLMAATRQLQTNIATTATYEPENTLDDPGTFSRTGIHVKTLLSPLFLIPTVTVIGAVIAANILLGRSAPVAFGAHHMWMEAGSLLLTLLFLFFLLRSRHIRHIQHQHVEGLVKDAVTLDTARKDFIHQIHIVLDMGLHDIAPHREPILSGDAASEAFRKHYDQLSSINDLLRRLYTQDNSIEHDAYTALEKTIASYLDDDSSRNKIVALAKDA